MGNQFRQRQDIGLPNLVQAVAMYCAYYASILTFSTTLWALQYRSVVSIKKDGSKNYTNYFIKITLALIHGITDFVPVGDGHP